MLGFYVFYFVTLFSSCYHQIPVFHTVNDYDLSGQTCPLQTRKSIACYPICVSDIDKCPQDFKPSCKKGWKFCQDGKCHRSCDGLPNICNCNKDNSLNDFMPCSVLPKTNILMFNKSIEKNQLVDSCSSAFNLDNQKYDIWSETYTPQSSNSIYWGVCPAPEAFFTYKEPMFISVFTIVGFEFLVLLLWYAYKTIRERNIKSVVFSEEPMRSIHIKNTEKDNLKEKAEKSDVSESEHGLSTNNVVKGYNNDYFGTFIIFTFFCISFGWFIWLGVTTADYYGAVDGTEFGIAYSSYNLSSGMYIGIWISATTWLVFMNVFRHRLRNIFRIQVFPLDARFVQIEKNINTQYMLDDGSKILRIVRIVETNLKQILRLDYSATTIRLNRTKSKTYQYFNYQCTRYVYNNDSAQFQPFDFDLGAKESDLIKLKTGLCDEEASVRVELKGPNFISVYVPSFFGALVQEFTSLFYLYQIMIMWLFYYFAYYEVGLVDTAVILVSALIKVVIRIKSEKKIKSMAEHVSKVMVLRDGEWTELSTFDLVPGDVYQVENGTTVPVDAIVLSGNIVADESSLTGEPLPIRKFPIKGDDTSYDRLGSNKINSLFSGTTVVQSIPTSKEGYVTALVYQTATSTDKGQLINKILYPSPISFVFDEQLKVVICILGLWGIVLFALSLWMQHKNATASWFYGMLCLSQILSPLLPAALVVGQSVAASQLRKNKIYCIDLPRITVAGKVQMFCFDKTGTLTKEGLEYFGAQVTKTTSSYNIKQHEKSIKENKFDNFEENFQNLPALFKIGTATCHAVTEVDKKKIGNPVDIEMFNSTKYELCNPQNSDYVDTVKLDNDKYVHIIKRYEFVHARMSMSVAVLDPESGNVHIFVKGSFEKVQSLCNPNSVPEEYTETTSKLAMEGCYVLAMAHRNLGNINPKLIDSWTREEMEEGISFIGLVVFKNKLKDDTEEAIIQLKEGNTRTIMITGDTALTGVYIARLSQMANENSQIYLADISKDGDVRWKDVDSKSTTNFSTKDIKAMFPKDGLNSNIELAVTGKAFKALFASGAIEDILLNVRVFARMDPQDKVDCVELHMKRGITAMCGDGGNDCGALRAAHIGLALSESEASIVSPFSSNHRSIMSCVELLKQGRAALASSFAGYKYLIMYGEIMACLKIFTFYFSISVSQATWIFIDAFITVLLSFAVSQSKAANKLAPLRPTARLLSAETLLSTLGQIFINYMFVIFSFVLLYRQSFYKCHEFDASLVDISKWYTLGDNFEAQTLAFVTLYQFINSAAIYNFGYHFRKSWIRNYVLVFLWTALVATVSCMLLMDPNWLGCQFRMNCGDKEVLEDMGYTAPPGKYEQYNIPSGHNVYPKEFRYKLFGYCIANMIAGIIWERIFIIGPVRKYTSKKYPYDRLKTKL